MNPDPITDVQNWLAENWDPDLTVGEWWDCLGRSGWAAPTWPAEWFGKGLSNADAAQVREAITAFGALAAPGGLGMLLAAPTILSHGSDDQKAGYLFDIVTGRKSWCQLFSEPVAGSDLAGIQTRARLDGSRWTVEGQKVWTSTADLADLGMLIARTTSEVPKHQGITYFVLDMHQDEIEVRPLRELTGKALFSEVFLTGAHVEREAVIGALGEGWRVANTTLAFERSGLGAGGHSGADSPAYPGTVVGHLTRRAGDVVSPRRSRAKKSNPFTASVQSVIDAAARHDVLADPTVRQGIARLHTQQEVGRYMAARHKALRGAGKDLPGVGNLSKLAMSQMFVQTREVGLQVLGARGMLHSYAERPDESSGAADADRLITEVALWSPGPSIYGGTDQIQRNILAERVLGLPREESPDRHLPFKDVPKNT